MGIATKLSPSRSLWTMMAWKASFAPSVIFLASCSAAIDASNFALPYPSSAYGYPNLGSAITATVPEQPPTSHANEQNVETGDKWWTLRELHSGDNLYCKDPNVIGQMMNWMNEQVDDAIDQIWRQPALWDVATPEIIDNLNERRVTMIVNISAGILYCSTNIPEACSLRPDRHACHVTEILKNGNRQVGTFFINSQGRVTNFGPGENDDNSVEIHID